MAQHDIGVMTLLASCQQSAADLGESAFARQLGPDIYPAVGPARAEEAGVKARPLGQFRALGHALKAAAAQQPDGSHPPRRTEARRVWQECVSQCKTRVEP